MAAAPPLILLASLLLLVACGGSPTGEGGSADASDGGSGGADLGGFDVNCGAFVEKGVDGEGNAPIAGCFGESPSTFYLHLRVEGVEEISFPAEAGRLPSAALRGGDACDATTIEWDGSLQPGAPRVTLFSTLGEVGTGPATGEYVGLPLTDDLMSLEINITELGEVNERVTGAFAGVNRAGKAVSGGFSVCRVEAVPPSP